MDKQVDKAISDSEIAESGFRIIRDLDSEPTWIREAAKTAMKEMAQDDLEMRQMT